MKSKKNKNQGAKKQQLSHALLSQKMSIFMGKVSSFSSDYIIDYQKLDFYFVETGWELSKIIFNSNSVQNIGLYMDITATWRVFTLVLLVFVFTIGIL